MTDEIKVKMNDEIKNLETNPENINFEPHPDDCGAVGYFSRMFTAIIGGESCTCSGVNELTIIDTPALLAKPLVYVKRTFSSRQEAEAFAKKWIAANHKRTIAFNEHILAETMILHDLGMSDQEIMLMAVKGELDPADWEYGCIDPETQVISPPVSVTEYEQATAAGSSEPAAKVSSPTTGKGTNKVEFKYPVFHLGKGEC